MFKKSFGLGCAIVFLGIGAESRAVIVWNESLNGDLSDLPGSPNAIALSSGANSVIGSVISTTDMQDWIALTVPNGFQLSSITLAAYASADQTGFTGFQVGSTFQGSSFSASSYNGYTHFGPGGIGSDLLQLMDDPTDTQGFTPPLGEGTYTFIIQQAGAALTTYQFDYNITPIPEPQTQVALALLCLLAVAINRAVPRLRMARIPNRDC